MKRKSAGHKKQREVFAAEAEEIDIDSIVAIDESGFTEEMIRPAARAPKGEQIQSFETAKPKRYSLISAISTSGVVAEIQVEGSVDGNTFLYFITEHLAPKLKPKQTVIMDNYSIHKVKGVKEAIEAQEASLLFLPSYSPEFNPIEPYFGNVKHLLRCYNTRTPVQFQKGLKKALKKVNVNHFPKWFHHCLRPKSSNKKPVSSLEILIPS